MTWKKLSSKLVFKDKYMGVFEDRVKLKSGKIIKFSVVRKKPYALIIPWDGKRFTLVQEYRYAVNALSWAFPQGHLEHASIKDTANAELREEAGLIAKKVKEIGKLYLAPGHNSQLFHIFLATDLTNAKQELEDSEEGMKVGSFTLEEFSNMIKKGIIKDSPTIAAFGVLSIKKLI